MITQREINGFFNILDILANPDKAKSELKVLADMRASVDADAAKAGDMAERAQNMMTEAKNLEAAASLALAQAKEIQSAQVKAATEMAEKDKAQVRIADQQLEIKQLQTAREEQLDNREAALVEKIGKYETSYADYLVRVDALRKNEADYRDRLSKLRAISN